MSIEPLLMNLAAVFAFINIILVLLLIYMYFDSWRKFRSSIAMTLTLFGAFFLIQNIIIVIFWYVLETLVPSAESVILSTSPYLFAVNLTETVALLNLVRVSMS